MLLITFFIAVSSGRTPEQAPNASAGQNTATDEAGIRAHIAGVEAALNKRDFAAFAAQFVPDGDYILVDGPTRSGQDAIRRTLEAGWANWPATSRIAITVEKIRSLGSDIAVVDASARFSEGEPAQDRATYVVVRRDGTWRTLVSRVLPAVKQLGSRMQERKATMEGKSALMDEELQLKKDEYQLKKDEFDFRKLEANTLQRIEKWKTWGNIASVALAAVALATPVWIAAMNIRAQRILAEEQAALTFRMKVADLALMNSTNAKQVKERTLAFAALFRPSPLLPDEFARDFDPKQFKLDVGNSIKTREQLVALLAQHPTQRKQILADWYVLFPWHKWWLEPLLEADTDEKKRLDDRSKRLQENEQQLNGPGVP